MEFSGSSEGSEPRRERQRGVTTQEVILPLRQEGGFPGQQNLDFSAPLVQHSVSLFFTVPGRWHFI